MANPHLPLRQRLGAVPRESGLRQDGWFTWCGAAIAVDGRYHLFASRWPVASGFPEGYRTHSEIVRASADSPLGPYTVDDVVIARRAQAGHWDSAMAHNPAIYRTGEGFALFYIGSDVGSRQRRIGVATAPAITGPWRRPDHPIDLGIDVDANNPAAHIGPDGVRLVWRTIQLRMQISTAATVGGPYQLPGHDVWPGIEDFFVFRGDDRWQIIAEDNSGAATGHERWGARLCSDDGVAWRMHADEPVAYDHVIRWTDGTASTLVRRERPWLLIENGAAICLFNGVYDGVHAWNQPVPITPVYPVQ